MGFARIDGRRVVVGGDDFTVRGGAADASIGGKQVYAEKMARELRMPIVRLVDGTGGGGSVRTQGSQGHTYIPANPGWDTVVQMLSEVPVVAAAMGSVAGLGAARVVTSHWSIMVKDTSQVFVAGPPVVAAGMGEEVDEGGPRRRRHPLPQRRRRQPGRRPRRTPSRRSGASSRTCPRNVWEQPRRSEPDRRPRRRRTTG